MGKDNLVLLSTRSKGGDPLTRIFPGNQLEFYIGGNGSHRYSMDKRSYLLSGILNNRKVLLETTITKIQDYEIITEGKKGYSPFCFTSSPKMNGEPKLTSCRKDNFPYWFITEPMK